MNIRKTIIICDDYDIGCPADCINLDVPEVACFSSEADLLKIYKEIEKIRGEDKISIVIKNLRDLLDLLEERFNGYILEERF